MDGLMEEGLKVLAAMSDERQEHCIHCNKKWYSMHYQDGVCHSCRKKGLPGRMAIQAARDARERISILAFVALFVILCIVFH